MKRNRRKSYNPLKMWGSYVGAFSGAGLSYLSLRNFWYDAIDYHISANCPKMLGELAQKACIQDYYKPYDLIQLINEQYFLYIIFGFIIGYAIHSLFRKFSK